MTSDNWADRCLAKISLIADSDYQMHEKRSSVRYAATGFALIKPEFGLHISCTVINRSDGGARLKVLSVLGVPDEFLLVVDAETKRARVAWRSPNELGVAFTLGGDTAADTIPQ